MLESGILLKELRLAKTHDGRPLSVRVLAKQVGVSAETVYRWERGEARIPRDRRQKLASIFGRHPDDFLSPDDLARGFPGDYESSHADYSVSLEAISERALPGGSRRDVPVHSTELDDNPGMFRWTGHTVDFVPRLPGIATAGSVFAFWMPGVAMEPRYQAGQLLYADEHRPVQAGRDVVINLRPNGDGDTISMVRTVVSFKPGVLELAQLNPAETRTLHVTEYASHALILTLEELVR